MCILPHAPRTLWTHSNGRTPQDQQAPYPTTVTNLLSPTSFPIGCRVAAAPSHTKHTNTNGTVTRHRAKFVEFAPGNCPPNTIHILHKSLTITSPPCDHSLHTLHQHGTPTTITRGHRDKENETDNIAYDNLAETAKFPVTNGFVSFTRMFCYLGSLIN